MPPRCALLAAIIALSPAPAIGAEAVPDAAAQPAAPRATSGADDIARIRAAATAGGSASQIELGNRYAYGDGVPQDIAASAMWLERAAAQGVVDAAERLATLHARDESVESRRAAVRWARKAAEAGDAGAQLQLAQALLVGKAVDADPEEAARWLRRAVDQRLLQAEPLLAWTHHRGLGVARDVDAALEWLLWPAGEERGHELWLSAGDFRFGDRGLHPVDPVFAALLYSISEQEGDAQAEGMAKRMLEDMDASQRTELAAMVARWSAASGSDTPRTAWLKAGLETRRLKNDGDRAGARAQATDALLRATERFGQRSPQRALALIERGWLESAADEHAAAEASMEQALTLRRSLHEAPHPAILDALQALAGVQRAAGEWSKAIPLLLEALPMAEVLEGSDSYTAAAVLDALGVAQALSDQIPAAIATQRRHLAIKRIGIPRIDYEGVARATIDLADSLSEVEGDDRDAATTEAESLYREVIRDYQSRVEGASQPPFPALSGLKMLLWRDDRYAELVPLTESIVAMIEQHEPVDEGALADARRQLAIFRDQALNARLPPGSPERLQYDLAAAGEGDVNAQQSLGDSYQLGLGVDADPVQAARWYRACAEQGEMVCQYNIGILHVEGSGVAADDKEAIGWLRKSADQGFAEAQASLGFLLDAGRGAERDATEALRLFRLAAERGSPTGQFNLGNSFLAGDGVPKDEGEALRLYLLAAEQDFPNAQHALGGMYRDGIGVTKDGAKAVEWFGRAAQQGNTLAQANLSAMYQGSNGVAANLPEAYFWMAIAARDSDDLVIERDALRKQLSAEQIAETDARVATWTPGSSQ